MKSFMLLSVCFVFTGAMGQTFTLQNNVLNSTSFYSPCVVDMNADGLDDVVTFSSVSGGYKMHIDYQQTDGTFNLVSFESPLFSRAPSWSICAGDLDQNGYNDLMVGAGDRVIFIKANSTGTGYTEQFLPEYIFSQRTNMVDIDNDGDLDAFGCHDVGQNHPYRNDGAGNMVEDQTLIETIPLAGNYASVWTDFDNDGDTDLYISKCRQGSSAGDVRRENMLYVNDGTGTFVADTLNEYGLFDNDQSWVTIFEDFDNDGDFDSYTVNHDISNNLRENDGTGHYTEVTAGSGIDALDLDSWALTSADFDNDGDVDILTESKVNGFQQFYRNNGGLNFTGLYLPFTKGALGDLNNDGFIDVFTGTNLWMNDGNTNNFIKIGLEGTTSNRNGIGSRLELYGAWGIQIRECRSGTDFKPMNSLDTHFGLGSHTEIDSLIVRWPSGTVDKIVNPTINARLQVVESQPSSNIRLVGVDPVTHEVTIKNFGDASEDISNYRLCSNLNYTFNGIALDATNISGDLDLAPDEEVTITWIPGSGFRESGDDMGLYLALGGFNNPASMVDYMQYITTDGARESVAVSKGIWTDDETVTGIAPYLFTGTGTDIGASFWEGNIDCSVFETAPVDLSKSFASVNGIHDRVQIKWYKNSPQIKYTDEDAAMCDIKFWKRKALDPLTGDPIGGAISNPDTITLTNKKKIYPDGSPRSIFKWPVLFRADGVNNTNRAEPNFRYQWKVRCECGHDGGGLESPWSAIKIFNTPNFDPVTGIYTPPGIQSEEFQWKKDPLHDLNIYPNPSSGAQIFIELASSDLDADLIEIQVLDITGKTVHNENRSITKDQGEIRIEFERSLTKGIYLLDIELNGIKSHSKFIVR